MVVLDEHVHNKLTTPDGLADRERVCVRAFLYRLMWTRSPLSMRLATLRAIHHVTHSIMDQIDTSAALITATIISTNLTMIFSFRPGLVLINVIICTS